MSQIRECDKCGKIIKKQDRWIAAWRIRNKNGVLYDETAADLCERCKDKVYKKFVDAINVD